MFRANESRVADHADSCSHATRAYHSAAEIFRKQHSYSEKRAEEVNYHCYSDCDASDASCSCSRDLGIVGSFPRYLTSLKIFLGGLAPCRR